MGFDDVFKGRIVWMTGGNMNAMIRLPAWDGKAEGLQGLEIWRSVPSQVLQQRSP